jgi:hypothetical protein
MAGKQQANSNSYNSFHPKNPNLDLQKKRPSDKIFKQLAV